MALRSRTRFRAGPIASIIRLFQNNEQGSWYDPSDFSTMYQDSAGTTPVTAVEQPVGKINDKSGRGNHATQATAASRPTLSARVNVFTKTDSVDSSEGSGVWIKGINLTRIGQETSAAGVQATIYAGDGSSSNEYVAQQYSVTSGVSYKVRVSARLVSGTKPTAGSLISAETTPGSPAVRAELTFAASSLSSTEGDFTVSFTAAGSGLITVYFLADQNNTAQIAVSRADLRISTDALNIPTYQRVNTATDYDTAGFPHGEKFDGVDDSQTSAIGGGGTAGFFWCGAVKVLGGADAARTIWSDTGTNTGYRIRINATNKLELAAGNATAFTTIASAANVAVGDTKVLTLWDDGTNLNVQINQGAVASAARPVVAAGTADFTVGKDNGAASAFLNGDIFKQIYRKDGGLTDSQRRAAQRSVAASAGVVL